MIKKTLAIAIAALSMAGVGFGLSAVPASAASMMGHNHPMMSDNGSMMGDHHRHWHRHQVCKTVWFHHHRHTVCHWM
jgi:hypothetical protein